MYLWKSQLKSGKGNCPNRWIKQSCHSAFYWKWQRNCCNPPVKDINTTKYLHPKVHTNTSTNTTRVIKVLHSRNASYGTPGQRVVPHTTVVTHALNVEIVNIDLDSTVPHKSSSAKIAVKQDTLLAAASTEAKQDKYHKNKPKDLHGITTQDDENENNTLPVESDQDSTSSNECFLVGTITAIDKVTVHDNTIFLIDLPITTKVHHKCWQMLHLKVDSGAMKNVMT